MKLRSHYLNVLLLLTALTLSACGGDDTDETPPAPVNSLPTASFVAPTPTAAIQEGDALSVTVMASDDDGTVSHVRLSINDSFIRQDNTAPYEWDSTQDSALNNLAAGTHELKADVTDNSGGVSSVTASIIINPAPANVLPTLTFVAPTPTTALTAGDSMSVSVSASDSDGTVSNVQLFFDGALVRQDNTAPYEWSPAQDSVLSNLAAGSYTLKADATDNDGGLSSVMTNIVVNAATTNTLPTASFVAPTPTSALQAGDSMSVTVEASDSDGSIANVKLYFDDVLVRQEGTAPYRWNPTQDTVLSNLTEGTHSLRADVTDNVGGVTIITTSVVVNPRDVSNASCEVSGALQQWHRVAITCDGPVGNESDDSTFTDKRFNVTFTQGSNSILVPGHFAADGDAANTAETTGNKWRAYFSPPQTGSWNYTTSFREGNDIVVSSNASEGTAVADIDGITGTFAINVSTASGLDMRARGLLQHRDGERYMRFAGNGNVFVQAGMDSPENIFGFNEFDNTTKRSGGSCKGILHSFTPHAGDWNTGDPTWASGKGKNLVGLVNYIASQGVNSIYIMMNTVRGDGCDAHPWSVYNSDATVKSFDVSKLDQWEIVLSHMTAKGILIHAMTQETENDQLLNGGDLGLERKLYYRELISRFGHHPALQWNLGEENTNTVQQQTDFANFIKAQDPYDHPIYMHTFPGQHNNYTPLLGLASFDGPTIQFGNIPGSSTNGVYGKTIEWINKSNDAGRSWVVTMTEASGNNAPTPNTNVSTLQRIYWMWANVMAGGGGFEWYLKNNGAGHAYDLAVENLREFDQHWEQSGYLAAFFRDVVQDNLGINLQSLSPDNNAVSGNAWVLSDPGNSYIVFLREGGNAVLNLSGSSNYDVLWFNPRTGQSSAGGSVSASQNLGNPPSQANQDWAVVLTSNNATSGLHPDIVSVRTDIPLSDIIREPGGNSWKDSYSVGDRCYCDSTFDHNIGPLPSGIDSMTVREVCDAIGPGPGAAGRPIYNDIQCGNGPANDAGDEDYCPGRVDIGKEGCRHIGPTWKLDTASSDYTEANGLVIMEAENTASNLDLWLNKTAVNGFTGSSYLEFNGNNPLSGPATSPLVYSFKINQGGLYYLHLHAARETRTINGQVRTDVANDGYVRLDGDYTAGPNAGNNHQDHAPLSALQSNTKFFGGNNNQFVWASGARLDLGGERNKRVAIYNLKAGETYTFTLSGRSQFFKVDRIVFRHESVPVSSAQNLANAETR